MPSACVRKLLYQQPQTSNASTTAKSLCSGSAYPVLALSAAVFGSQSRSASCCTWTMTIEIAGYQLSCSLTSGLSSLGSGKLAFLCWLSAWIKTSSQLLQYGLTSQHESARQQCFLTS